MIGRIAFSRPPWPHVAASVLVAVLSASPAHAFQNPDTFSGDPTKGGGGGRFFTGAPLDAYTCEVCHHSESAPDVRVFGLPDGAYVPGALYRVTIDWPDDLARVALTMEMTDRLGRTAGVWSEPDLATLTPADRCALAADTPAGARILPIAADRAIISAIDCGQLQTTLNWTAPAQLDPVSAAQFPDLMLSGALVVSNTNGKLAGDRVAAFTRGLAPPGAVVAPAASVRASCSVMTPQRAPRGAVLRCALALLGLLGFRARSKRREVIAARARSRPDSGHCSS